MRRVARLILLLWGMGSAAAFGTVLYWIATDPAARAFRDATIDEITASTDRMLAESATPDHMATLIAERLDQDPRNWLALDALMDMATQNAIPLPPDLTARFAAVREQDHGLLATAGSCAVCLVDSSSCSLTEVFVCQAPVNLTPVGDVLGIGKAASAYALGDNIDTVDLALSIVGLGATVAVLTTGGGSLVVKAGAGLMKTAMKMGRVSRPLLHVFETAILRGVNWTKLADARSLDAVRAAVRVEDFAEVTRIANALGDVAGKTDLTTALHLLPMVDNAADAERLAKTATALGPKLLAKAEVLGKVRLFRATLRASDIANWLLTSFASLIAAAAGLIGTTTDSVIRQFLRRSTRA
jgi:hypothetical protein